ncbi:DUF4136 domain-containing protein [Chitinolyticbacter meiyuanensis]|uniref:DUF4136 domain-containing protein n=1 Tax=Chitinolyticbacter meiyuanensis TaxID=682798 RepID=UPI0011E5D0E5|nr:DUF4136 domain-containing protein [Chitinolyticbacter meiyuanensis]
MLRGLVVLLAVLLTACATPQFVAEVNVRHDLNEPFAGKRFAFQRGAGQSQSLLQREVEVRVGDALAAQGLIQVERDTDADWLVALDYGVDDGKTVVTQQPVWGTVGYSIYYQRISTGNGVVLVPSYFPETGIVGSVPVTDTVYTRHLAVDILDRLRLQDGGFAKRYEGRARNQADNPQFDPALPWLTQALFQFFPGFSGTTREVRFDLPQR